ncbi:hypothetical protein A7A76_21535 [Lysobacter enzymogenes]|uniref:hypothetical protein n=1 Tax=Lysobacter enzymogenes TaxID=69 RepID=UPI0019CFBCD7|nr:hypothetical protein [Lysobacter enzymogenes]MBN7137304.1 hypothetical protein [Lysobacter enzymogenes]
MRINAAIGLSAVALALAMGHAEPARAGDVGNAGMECYVDTFRFDIATADQCTSLWVPNGAHDPSVAVFSVTGLPPGNYGFVWRNLENNLIVASCANQSACAVPIATDRMGDGIAILQATVTDLDTGASRQVQATAYYFDGYT